MRVITFESFGVIVSWVVDEEWLVVLPPPDDPRLGVAFGLALQAGVVPFVHHHVRTRRVVIDVRRY